jgi:hypothetical protein
MKRFFVLLLFFPLLISAQSQEQKVLGYNVGFGALTSGLGAVINKKKAENWKKSFLRGFWQGSIGGLINYSAKKTIYYVDEKDNLAYALLARLISSAGNSIIQNAAFNEPFLTNWNLEYGFLRFDYSVNSVKKFKVRILPASVIGTALALPKGRLDIGATLLSGMMVFHSKELINTLNNKHDGINYGSAMVYYGDTLRYHIISHEIIHEYQYREYLVFNSYLKKEMPKIKESGLKRWITKYIYPDLPYFGLFYTLMGVESGPRYFKNYFEFEAERFATNRYVRTN